MQVGSPEIMQELGEEYIRLSRPRIEAGIGSDGQMPDLRPRYAREKGEDVRTLSRTGEMLDSRSVVEATDTRAVVAFGDDQVVKAAVNEERSPFVQPTAEELEALAAKAAKLLQQELYRKMNALAQELNRG